MFERLFTSQQPIFGLDIGHDTLKVVQLRRRGRHIVLHSYQTVPIPADCITKNEVREPEKLLTALHEAIAASKPHAINTNAIVSALPESHVFTKIVSLPSAKPSEIGQMINYQASEIFPVPLEEIYLDWQILGQSFAKPSSQPTQPLAQNLKRVDMSASSTKQMPKTANNTLTQKTVEVLVVAAPRRLVDTFRGFLQHGGFDLVALETKPIATARAITQPKETSGLLLLDIGAETTSISIIDKGILRLTGTVTAGGDNIFRVNSAISAPIPRDSRKLDAAMAESKPDSSQRAISQSLTPITEEINRILRYYHNRVQADGRINTIRVTGGGARLEAIYTIIKQQTGCRIETGNPFVNISKLPAGLKPEEFNQYASAIGCSLRNILEQP